MVAGKSKSCLGFILLLLAVNVSAEETTEIQRIKCAIETERNTYEITQVAYPIEKNKSDDEILRRQTSLLKKDGVVYAEDGKTKLRVKNVYECVKIESDFKKTLAREIEESYPQ